MADEKNYGGIANNYVIKPKNLANYTALRGVTDFTQIGQFDQFETGYSFLIVLGMPTFITKSKNSNIKQMAKSFQHMLEYEFRGLSGLPDTQADTFDITDGVNTQRMINNVSRDTSVTLTSPYFERSGSLITKFTDYYLTGIKDPMTKAKTYHGLIKDGILQPSFKNEVFTFMYIVTDNTYMRIEKAFLLCNCQLTKAEESMYDSTKGDIGNKEMNIEWNCFPVQGELVDKAAYAMLADITGYKKKLNGNMTTYKGADTKTTARLDSTDENFAYAILDPNAKQTKTSADGTTSTETVYGMSKKAYDKITEYMGKADVPN